MTVLYSNGVPIYNADSVLWDDIRVPMSATKDGGSKIPGFAKLKDDGAASQGVYAHFFDKSSEEELYFSVQIPHSYKYGTNFHPHVHCCPIDTDTGIIRWGLEYTLCEIGGVIGNTSIIYTDSAAAAPGIAFQHTLLEFSPEIDGSAIDSVSTMIMCRVFRDVTNDDYDNDAVLLEVDFHFQKDSRGSRQEYTK